MWTESMCVGIIWVMKRPVGRPTKYNKGMIDKIQEYLDVYQDEERQVLKQSSEKYEMFDTKLTVKLPTIEGFARFVEVNKDTLYEWRQQHKIFSDSLEKILIEQQERLINNGLSGDYNSTIAKLILSSNHGMVEKKETDLTSGGKPLNINLSSEIVKRDDKSTRSTK